MPALNFLKEFVSKIESGEKTQTIRVLRKRPFKRGDRLYLYTGQRTKGCRKLGEHDCVRVDHIRINSDFREVIVNGVILSVKGSRKLAVKDGFQDEYEFFEFFHETHGDDFEGQLITWG